MKEVVLLIGHGSRDDDGNQEFMQFVDLVQKRLPERAFEACFLELATPDISTGIEACIKKGATRIVAIPLILLAASHVKDEIPEHLGKASVRHPQVEIKYGKNVGLHESILELLVERFQKENIAQGYSDNDLESTALVLMGRGSSDPDANGDLFKIGRLLYERLGVFTVETCFSGITTPLFPGGIARAIALGAERIVVLPYFLFTGVLIKRMRRTLQALQAENPHVPMVMCDYFGMHPLLVDVVAEQVGQLCGSASGQAEALCQS